MQAEDYFVTCLSVLSFVVLFTIIKLVSIGKAVADLRFQYATLVERLVVGAATAAVVGEHHRQAAPTYGYGSPEFV
jgi:hypothetical protein